MKKVTIKAADMKPENDKAKKIYRSALDIIRRVDDIGKQKRAFKEVFLPDTVNLRNRLQDYCERLMFYNPAEYGRKAEELLWRKVYYDVIQLMKHNRKQMKPSTNLESAFRMHLSAAVGYYNHLLLKLQSEYSLKLEGIVDLYHYPEPKNHRKSAMWGQRREPEPEVKDWALKACHRCLVQLGDLCRYQQDYDEHRSEAVAQRYYYQAIALAPHIGMPHNQLGTLAGNKSYNLQAIYHYLRCIASPSSFDGAEGNLTRLFERNRKRYIELSQTSPRDLPPDQQRFKDIKRFFVRFIHLLDIFFSRDQNSTPAKEVQDLCQVILQDFNLCMFYQPPPSINLGCSLDLRTHEEKPTFMEDDTVFKITVICMIAMYTLQKSGNKQVTAAIAFSLALFSHILNHVVMRLQSALYDLQNPRKILHLVSEDDKGTTTTDFEEEPEDKESCKRRSLPRRQDSLKKDMAAKEDGKHDTNSVPVDKKKQKLKKMLQKRRRRRGSSSGSESGADLDHSDASEGGGDTDDSETELRFLNQSSSSESDSDDLMISQEMRPGFSDFTGHQPGSGQSSQEESADSGHGLTIEHQDIDQALHESPLNNNNKFSSNLNGLFGHGENMNNNHSDNLKAATDTTTSSSQPADINNQLFMTNAEHLVSSYLKEFPVDWLHDSSSVFSQTLHLAKLLVATGDGQQDADMTAVMQGTKEVKVPPGFETSTETEAVKEITEKIANFTIETDTDTSNLPTDTECSTVTTESEMETETETDKDSVIDRCEVAKQKLDGLLRVISGEGLLASIKIFSDWMRCNQHIITTCAKSSTSLWARLSLLLNFFPLEVDIAKADVYMSNQQIDELHKSSQPLTEDIHLQCFQPLEMAHTNINFSSRLDLSEKQEAIFRVCVLRRFGHYVSGIKSISFHYDQEKAMFFGPVQNQSCEGEQAAQQQMAEAQAKRNQLMKDMAQLRLKAEVSQLEGCLESGDRPSLPPYLVPDTSVVCDSLTQLKQLAHSARFIVIIPSAVIDHLDLLKKESPRARDAIRWLEAEFKKGNRYLRAQKLHEKTSKLPHKNMKKKDRDAWRYVQIVDCAKYLGTQTSQEETTKGMVSVLTNHCITSPHVSIRVKQVISTAQQEGISIQNASEFYSKWKDVCKSNSKG